MSRKFLVTKLVCAKCGENLSLSYDLPKGAPRYADGEPTGADKVEQRVAVEPCQACFRPLFEMREAVGKLLGEAKPATR